MPQFSDEQGKLGHYQALEAFHPSEITVNTRLGERRISAGGKNVVEAGLQVFFTFRP